MIPKECKRLIEVDFPLAAVNRACDEENKRKTRIESGHISLLHTWWARRPLASCRAMLLGVLLPDPANPLCSESFKETARCELRKFAPVGKTDLELRKALLQFVGEASDFDLLRNPSYHSSARRLVQAAWDEVPHVFDPFAGGGSIPLEAARLGCETTASELNPVAWLILKVTLGWAARYGDELVDLFEKWSRWVLERTAERLVPYYPKDEEGRLPLAYLWARWVRCEAPRCGVKIPLVRNLWLSERSGRKKAVRIRYDKEDPEPRMEVFMPENETDVKPGTVSRFRAICPKCGRTTPRKRVQAQLRERNGGGDDALLIAVARQRQQGRGKDYHNPTTADLDAARKAEEQAVGLETLMPAFPAGDTRAFPPHPYGITNWVHVLTPRQRLSRWVIRQVIEDALKAAGKEIRDPELCTALAACLYAAYSDNSQYHTSLCLWLSEGVTSIFIQGSGVPMRADFVEGSPLSPNCEGLGYSIRSVQSALRSLSATRYQPSSPLLANALEAILPRESVDIVFTDPPYANQIPYAHLSDLFHGNLRLGLRNRVPQGFGAPETQKASELTENHAVKDGGVHDRHWYEDHMREAFAQLKGAIREDGVSAVVFAHKDTDRWEALVSALIQAGWRTTASWPIATERRQRMRGQGYAALQTSVHLVCRPRPETAAVGDWNQVRRELPVRVGDWMERLQGEGIRGADLVFACIGPALEIYSRYSKVVDAEDREIPLGGDPEAAEPHERGFLSYVWETVGRTALGQVLGTTEAKARNSAAGALEEDARLTALFLWTLQSTASGNGKNSGKASEDEDSGSKRTRASFSLIYDVVRRFAQPLGIHLEEWEDRIIETKKGVVRLLRVEERAKQLFGKEGAEAVADRIEETTTGPVQLTLLPAGDEGAVPEIKGRGRTGRRRGGKASDEDLRTRREATTLDRVHAAMLLQASGRTNALRALIKAEQERGPEFLRLANALSALYPKDSEEKRLLDAMLLAAGR